MRICYLHSKISVCSVPVCGVFTTYHVALFGNDEDNNRVLLATADVSMPMSIMVMMAVR